MAPRAAEIWRGSKVAAIRGTAAVAGYGAAGPNRRGVRRILVVLWVVENVQHPATFAIQLDLVSKYLRVAGCSGLIDVVDDLRQRMLADNAII